MHVPGLPPKLELRPGQGYLFRIYMRGRTPCSPEVADMVVEVPFDTEGQQAGGGREITLTPLRSPTVDDMAPLEENFPGAGRIMRRYLLQGRLCVPEVADLVEERILFETSPGQWERWAGREAALQPLRAPKGPQDFLTDDGVISGTVKEVLDELSAMSEIY